MNAATPIPALSDGTTAAIANLIDYTIEREYDTVSEDAANGVTILALAWLQVDLRDQFVSINGTINGIDGYAQATLRILLRDGLEARRCQCHTINGVCPHGTDAHCARHYEADVPAIDGALLCGTCHIAAHQARG